LHVSSEGGKPRPPSPVSTPVSQESVLTVGKVSDDVVHIEAVGEKRKLIIFGRTKPVLACLLLLLLAVIGYFTLVRGGKNSGTETEKPTNTISVGDISFIKVVYTDNHLPKQPDWKTTTVETTDSQGNAIEVVLGVLWDPYRWVMADTHYVAVDKEERIRYKIEDVIKTFQADEKRPIVVVGTASHENVKENPQEEIGRAADRADKLVAICSDHFRENKPHIYSINLGGFRSDKTPSLFSASERRVVLLVITQGENSPDLTSGIKKAFIKAKEEQNFIFDARDYSLFDSERMRVMPRANF